MSTILPIHFIQIRHSNHYHIDFVDQISMTYSNGKYAMGSSTYKK